MAATAAKAAPMAKAMTMMRSVLMPISFAVSGSCAVACMARPVRVLATKKPRTIMQIGAAMSRKTSPRWMVAPRMSKAVAAELREGAGLLGVGVEAPDGLLEGEGEADGGDERREPWVRRAVAGRRTVPLRRATRTETTTPPTSIRGRASHEDGAARAAAARR